MTISVILVSELLVRKDHKSTKRVRYRRKEFVQYIGHKFHELYRDTRMIHDIINYDDYDSYYDNN